MLTGALPALRCQLIESGLKQQVACAIEVQCKPVGLMRIGTSDDVLATKLLVACDRLGKRIADAGALTPARAIYLERRPGLYQCL